MDFWEYVATNAKADPHKLRLAADGKKYDFDVSSAIIQIEARRKFGRKLSSTLTAFERFLFPSMLAGEQSTSDLLAEYHSGLCAAGMSCVDLTAGLGIDALHITRRASEVTAIERTDALCKALEYNAKGLRVDNLEVICGDCREFVERAVESGRSFEVAFIDPARRSADGGRVYGFEDCEPDICAMMPELAKLCKLLIIKASPMLDIAAAVQSLGRMPRSVIALGTPTECKELLFIVDFAADAPEEAIYEAVTLSTDNSGGSSFAFAKSSELGCELAPTQPSVKPGDTICEPSPCIMKMAPFRLLARQWGLCGFGNGTHLFYRATPPDGSFPGRLYTVLEVLPYASKVIKRLARKYPVAQIATRNFGMSADELRGRLGIRQGDTNRIFGITDAADNRMLIVC